MQFKKLAFSTAEKSNYLKCAKHVPTNFFYYSNLKKKKEFNSLKLKDKNIEIILIDKIHVFK